MDPWQMLTSVLAMFSAALGWWLISLHNRHEKLRADHEELRVRVAERYLQKDELRELIDDMKKDIHTLIQSLRDELRSYRGQR
ncbi:hypothetical protein VI26_18165 [Chromobacterium sp. LK1]|uniref:hypothetical protein n=1 Tax=Chromobacterium sp. LK1 TaxID=1628193 RepID=UPI0006542586|nr:hypothetical protein [Chromobacterium sp. LK1]KMN32092.1 hypothetical protein VI26_18165 [Chromobacterium sp. LK1]